MTNNISPKSPRAVTFAPFGKLSFIPKDDAKSKWYTSHEKRSSRDQMVQDIRRMHKKINATPSKVITKEQLHQCIGIELYLTPELMKHVIQEKKSHVKAVLSEQRNQEHQGIQDPEKIRCVSRKSSQWARSRARKLAVGYSQLND